MYGILLTGTYSSYNKGDAAMEISTAKSIQSSLTDVKITVASTLPQIDRSFYKQYEIDRAKSFSNISNLSLFNTYNICKYRQL